MRLWTAALLAAAAILAALALGAALGETAIPLETVAKTAANRLFDAGYNVNPIDAGIVWEYRLARAVVAACCGVALALSGVVLQALLRNALADPYILGISAGASTGAVAVAILGLGAGLLSPSMGAFLGALLAFGTVAALARAAGSGAALVAELKAREAAAIARVAEARNVPVLFWFTSPDMDMDASVDGSNGAPTYMISKLHARNVIVSEDEWRWVDWETIAKADPAVIVLAGMDRRFNVGDDPARKEEFLTSDPVARRIPAVEAGHYFAMRAEAMNPSIRTIDGIEQLSEKIAEFGLAE